MNAKKTIFYIFSAGLWFMVAVVLEQKAITPLFEDSSWFRDSPELILWITRAIITIIGWVVTYLSKDYLKTIVKGAISDHVNELVKDASEDPYLTYAALIKNTTTMKDFVDELYKFPNSNALSVLIGKYADYMKAHTSLMDFETFLKIGTILASSPSVVEMKFVNITPPYEWVKPFNTFKKHKGVEAAINEYNQTVENKIKNGIKVSRISVVKNQEELTSVLESGFFKYCKLNNINIESKKPDLLNKSLDKLSIDKIEFPLNWINEIVSEYLNSISKNGDFAHKLTNFLSQKTSIGKKFLSFIKDYFHTQEFHDLSKNISAIILSDFIEKSHSPSKNASYIVQEDIRVNKKVVEDNFRDAGIFITMNNKKDNENYYLCIEKSDTLDVIVATLRKIGISDIKNETAFGRLWEDVVNKQGNKNTKAVGKLSTLLS